MTKYFYAFNICENSIFLGGLSINIYTVSFQTLAGLVPDLVHGEVLGSPAEHYKTDLSHLPHPTTISAKQGFLSSIIFCINHCLTLLKDTLLSIKMLCSHCNALYFTPHSSTIKLTPNTTLLARSLDQSNNLI